jgi:hypothetical protein
MKLFALALLASCLAAGSAAAAEDPAAPAAPASAAMEKAKKLMEPTEAHKALEPFAGRWNYTSKFWMDPNSPPQEMKGTAVNEIVYGGRFLKQTATGPWMGEMFEGIGYTGYDNVKQQYESVWIDSMGTGIYKSAGRHDAASRTLRFEGSNSCPLTGQKEMKSRAEWKIVDDNTHVMTHYIPGPDGQEMKGMELIYTRA